MKEELYMQGGPDVLNMAAEPLPQNYNPEKDFTTLDAWKKARKVRMFFYNKIVPLIPSEEKFNLIVQIRKAAVSVTANIAEGYGRYHYGEGIQFYRISRGSMYELKDHLISCNDFSFIDSNLFDDGLMLIEDAKATLNGYIKYCQSKKVNG